MKKYVLLIFILTGMILVQYSCKKKTPGYGVNGPLKTAFSFKPGTYWIFRDSLTAQVDSFYVRGLSNVNITTGTPKYTYEDIVVDIREVNGLPAGTDTSNWKIGMVQNDLYISDYYEYTGINYDPVPYPFVSGNYSNIHTEFVKEIGNYLLNGNTFGSVADIEVSTGINDSVYVNADVGLIKLKINHGAPYVRVWELQRWKIVK